MGLFDKWRKKSQVDLEKLKSEPYEQKYFEECKFIWDNYVPESGQAETLQGELLREVEKLRWEAQNNGNINWDEDFVYFCGFIKDTLCAQRIYSPEEKAQIRAILDYLEDCGNYAMAWGEEEISDDEVDVDRVAYVDDNLYDRIADYIGLLQGKHPQPIAYSFNEDIRR